MTDPSRTNQELIEENALLKQRIQELEISEAEHKRAEEALRESEKKCLGILENMDDAYYELDLNGNFVFFNEILISKTGYSRGELMGMNYKQYISPETCEPVSRVFSEIYRTGQPVRLFDYEVITKGGQTRNYESWAGLLFDNNNQPIGFRGMARDITERKQAEEELRESEEKYRNILENIEDGYFEVDLAGNFTFFNPSLCHILGYPREEMPGMNNRAFMDAENAKKIFQVFNEVYVTGIPRKGFEWETIRKDGARTYIEVSVSLIARPGEKPTGFRGIARDVTERKKAEGKLQQTVDSLRKAVGATIQVMVSSVETRDPYTAGHQIRSAALARTIATEMGLSQEKIEGIRIAGSIHDIGKLSVPAEILSKPTKLLEIEFSLIKEHAKRGYEILKDVESSWPLAEIVYEHHERMDGSGYPRGLKSEEILIEARVLAVADVVEAMASHRPYRPALGMDAALQEIEKNRGILYDPAVVDICLMLIREKGFQLNVDKHQMDNN
jgi:PAS domain S-box-containing protein